MNTDMDDDIGNIPAAELVEEWRRLRKTGKRNPLYWSNQHDKNLVASELDRRCEAEGLAIQFGTHLIFKHAKSVVSNYPYPEWKISMEASELHALLGWLLMKGGTGK